MPGMLHQKRTASSSHTSSVSDYSANSDHSVSTAPTDESFRPPVQQYKLFSNPYSTDDWDERRHHVFDNSAARASTETYASSVSSVPDLDQGQDHDLPPYDPADDGCESVGSKVVAASPQEFAQYFPSTQRLHIKHDDSTLDGNMNIRVDTTARTYEGGEVALTLFHMRMHELKHREFSLRRYCRDSGREICHSNRKYSKPSVITRPGLQRSMSNALSSLRSKSENKTATMNTSLNRHDSGYASLHNGEPTAGTQNVPSRATGRITVPTNTTLLQFSNYAHLEVKRRGGKSSKRYNFGYWGTKYTWKRIAVTSGNFKEISYHLYDTKTSLSLAHIVPVPQSRSEQREEIAKGGWVPSCSMILEESIAEGSSDLAE